VVQASRSHAGRRLEPGPVAGGLGSRGPVAGLADEAAASQVLPSESNPSFIRSAGRRASGLWADHAQAVDAHERQAVSDASGRERRERNASEKDASRNARSRLPGL
jgi:hypothetical protein